MGSPRSLQWKGGPEFSRNHDKISSVNAVVSDSGRIYSIIDEGSIATIYHPPRWTLSARDAFSGVVLWKKRIGPWMSHLFRLKNKGASIQMPRRLVAADGFVYVTLGIDKPVSKLDGATGELLATYEDTAMAEELIHNDGRLAVVCADERNTEPLEGVLSPEQMRRRGISTELLPRSSARRSVAVIDTANGATLWKKSYGEVTSLSLVCDAENVLFLALDKLHCVNARTGRPVWEKKADVNTKPLGALGKAAPTVLLYDGVIYVASRGKITAFDTGDGEQLWSGEADIGSFNYTASVLIHEERIWNVNTGGEFYSPAALAKLAPDERNKPRIFFHGHNLKTGEVEKTIPMFNEQGYAVMHHRCHVPRAAGDCIITGFPGVEFVDTRTGDVQHNSWLRGACLYGFLPANGLLYCPPHPCTCYIQGKLSGFVALAPAGAREENRVVAGARLHKGPAFADIRPDQSGGDELDWPTYRGGPERAGTYPGPIADELKLKWRSQIGGKLSQPVIAGDTLLCVSLERNKLIAMDAATGETRWSHIFSGRVDSPPTLHQGMAITGCSDGYVYNFRMHDGELIWRFRAAPDDARLVAYNRVESVWPVHGSVLVHDDRLWFAAGRNSYLDGGIDLFRLDPATARVLSTTHLNSLDSDGRQPEVGKEGRPSPENRSPIVTRLDMKGAKPGILSSNGSAVFMKHLAFDAEGEEIGQNINHLYSPYGFLEDHWFHRSYWIYGYRYLSGAQGWSSIAKSAAPTGQILSVGRDLVYGYGRRGTQAHGEFIFFATKKDPPPPAQARRTKTSSMVWSVPADLQTPLPAARERRAALDRGRFPRRLGHVRGRLRRQGRFGSQDHVRHGRRNDQGIRTARSAGHRHPLRGTRPSLHRVEGRLAALL